MRPKIYVFIPALLSLYLAKVVCSHNETDIYYVGESEADFFLNSCPSFHAEILRICKTPQGSCATRCGEQRRTHKDPSHVCSCDSMCLAYNDCCGDYAKRCRLMRMTFYRQYDSLHKIGTTCIDGYKVINACPRGTTLQNSQTMEYRNMQPVVTSTLQPDLHFKNFSVHDCFSRAFGKEMLVDKGIPWDFELQFDMKTTSVSSLADFLTTANTNSSSSSSSSPSSSAEAAEAAAALGRIRAVPKPPSLGMGRECDGVTMFQCKHTMTGDASLCEHVLDVSERFFQIVCGGSAMLRVTTRTSLEPVEITSLAHPPTGGSSMMGSVQSCKHGRPSGDSNATSMTLHVPMRVERTGSVYIQPWTYLSRGGFCRDGFPQGQCHLALNCSTGYFFDGNGCWKPSYFTLSLVVSERDTDLMYLAEELISATLLETPDWEIELNSTAAGQGDGNQTITMAYVYRVLHFSMSQNIGYFDLYITSVVAEKIQCQGQVFPSILGMSLCLSHNNLSTGIRETCDTVIPYDEQNRVSCDGLTGNGGGISLTSIVKRASILNSSLYLLVCILVVITP